MNEQQQQLPVIKMVVVGDSGVGKSCLLLRFCDDQFSASFTATVGIDFKIRTVTLAGGRRVRLQIWDTAGQDRFRAITSAYYRGAQAVLLVFAIDARESFASLPAWLAEVRAAVSSTTHIALVANKCDALDAQTVSHVSARSWAAAQGGGQGMRYYEVSAKSGQGVSECFIDMAERIPPAADAIGDGEQPSTTTKEAAKEAESIAEYQARKACCLGQ